MKIKQYQVDAFTHKPFSGNPAAVCLLEHWPEDTLLQAIAEENNLSETAFLVPIADGFHLRWFTPSVEAPLCGHGTLAAAHVVFEHLGFSAPKVVFQTLSGDLTVARESDRLVMDFPSRPPERCTRPPIALFAALGCTPLEVWAADDYLAVFENEEQITGLNPDFEAMMSLDLRGVIVTAKGKHCDFVSRFFGPKIGINEGPVTGSSHCQLAPLWADKLGELVLLARQLSKRKGEISCELQGRRVLLTGIAVTVMSAEIHC